MESETYLTYTESTRLQNYLFSSKRDSCRLLNEMGLIWIYERIQYQIVDNRLWFLAKIKYGI